jgi:chromosomal replication initiator protein
MEDTIKTFQENSTNKILADKVIQLCCAKFDTNEKMVKSKSRKQLFVYTRHAAAYVIFNYSMGQFTLSEIGGYLGKRDHSTMIYAVNKCQERMNENPDYKEAIEDIIARLKTSENE